jgi:glutathione synthase/RimK-type ligase-like ATP-grasp enzyme
MRDAQRVIIATCERHGARPDVDGAALEPILRELGLYPVFWPWERGLPDVDAVGCLLKATWDYHERPDDFVVWVDGTAARMPVWNAAGAIRWNIHKMYLMELEAAGIPIVPTILVRQGQVRQADTVWSQQPWDEVVVKPAISVGALRTERFAADAGSAFLADLLRSGDALIQRFVPSVLSRGETSIVHIDGRFAHAVHKQVVPGTFVAQPNIGAPVRPCEPDPWQRAVAEAAMALVPDSLFGRVDLVELDGEPVVMELELIEPALYLNLFPDSAMRLASAIAARAA